MSGAGRKHRAKHLTQQYLDVTGWVGPLAGETLAVCLESPRGQHVRVLLLFARAEDVAKVRAEACKEEEEGKAVPPQVGSSNSSSPTAAETLAEEAEEVSAADTEQLVFLPGKFHKVIWLSIKDIVVVSDGTVTFKPSPEQMENFMKNPANAGWRERIAAAQQRAEGQRVAVQRMPQYGATANTTTSVLKGPQVQREARPSGEEVGEEEDAMDDMVNPNWGSIKHHQQFFYGMDDDSDEQEEGEEEEEEDEEDAERK